MSIEIRCPHCKRYFGAPDLESVKVYAANGGMIQTLTQRTVAQPIHRHYVTLRPFWLATALAMIPVGLGPAEVLYFGVDPALAFGLIPVTFGIGLIIASTNVEEQEITDEPPADDEPEAPQAEPAPMRFEEITRPGKNSMTIRLAHEPPASADPARQQTLGHADLALARLATGEGAIAPVSFANAKKHGYKFGEPAFYEIQRRWIKEGIAFRSGAGAVYLKPSGIKTLRQYANQ